MIAERFSWGRKAFFLYLAPMKILAMLLPLFLLRLLGCSAQVPKQHAHCQNADFDKKVENMLSFTVPTIDPDGLKKMQSNAIILDAREPSEYAVSHIAGAKNVGYNELDKKMLATLDKSTPVVVYCSIGYRSEKIGEKLQKMGFQKVYNLYGSIFEWVNQGNPVVGSDGKTTKKVHTYNQKWSKWVQEGKVEKVW